MAGCSPLNDRNTGNTSSRHRNHREQEEEEGNNEPQEGTWALASTSAAPRLANIDQQVAVVRRKRNWTTGNKDTQDLHKARDALST